MYIYIHILSHYCQTWVLQYKNMSWQDNHGKSPSEMITLYSLHASASAASFHNAETDAWPHASALPCKLRQNKNRQTAASNEHQGTSIDSATSASTYHPHLKHRVWAPVFALMNSWMYMCVAQMCVRNNTRWGGEVSVTWMTECELSLRHITLQDDTYKFRWVCVS